MTHPIAERSEQATSMVEGERRDELCTLMRDTIWDLGTRQAQGQPFSADQLLVLKFASNNLRHLLEKLK